MHLRLRRAILFWIFRLISQHAQRLKTRPGPAPANALCRKQASAGADSTGSLRAQHLVLDQDSGRHPAGKNSRRPGSAMAAGRDPGRGLSRRLCAPSLPSIRPDRRPGQDALLHFRNRWTTIPRKHSCRPSRQNCAQPRLSLQCAPEWCHSSRQ